jgi:tight adherence protein C
VVVFAGLSLFIIAVVLVVFGVYSRQAKRRKSGANGQGSGVAAQVSADGWEGQLPEMYRTVQPLVKLLAAFNRLLPLSRVRQRYAHQIERAGLRFELSADEFIAIKIAGLLALTAVGLVVYFAVMPKAAIVLLFAFIGFMYPDSLLSSKIKKRELACLRALPGFLDLLALTVEAGLGFDSAVRKLTEVLEPGPLIQSFRAFLRSMNVGKPRIEALREMARKLDLPDFTAFANAVVQATETGANMGPVLRTESGEMLFRRFERAEKAAYELPVKILFPLLAFVFPATFLMIIGPLFFQIKASGALGGF